MIRLNRIKLFLLGFGVIALCYFVRQVSFIAASGRAHGEVISVSNKASGRHNTRLSYPAVRFTADGRNVVFTAESNLDVERGDRVEVIYKIEDPADAHIYTFSGFWLRNIIWFIIPLVVWTAFSLSYLDKHEYLSLNLRSLSESRRSRNNPQLPQDWSDKKRLE